KSYKFINQPLFEESSTTDDLLKKYEIILNKMLENYIDFEIEDVHFEISKQVPLGYNISLPNVVILKPNNPPNCNDNVHAVYKMYHEDLLQSCDKCLYIACNQAIFGSLISYKETHNDI
ncbi:15035_t:CDS:1, partial [Gigaspora rosea]